MDDQGGSCSSVVRLFRAHVLQNPYSPLHAVSRFRRDLETSDRERAGTTPTHLGIGLEDGIERSVHAIKDAEQENARGISPNLLWRAAPGKPHDHCVKGNGAKVICCSKANPSLRIQGTQLSLKGRVQTALSTINNDDRVTFCV